MHLVLVTLLTAAAPDAAAPAAPAPAAAPAAGPRLELPALVERVQKRYDQTSDLRARFTQNFTAAALARTRVRTGELLLKKPGKMKLAYDSPDKEMYLANGQTVWKYDPEDKQAFREDLKHAQLPAAFAFLMGRGKLKDEFEIAFATGQEAPYGAAGDYKLSLKPKKPQTTYKAIYFIVDPTSLLVKQSVLVGAEGNVNSFSFADITTNTKLGDDTFRWSPPSDVRVIDVGKMTRNR